MVTYPQAWGFEALPLLRDVRHACCDEVSYGVVRCVVAHAARTGLAAGGQGTAP